MIEQLSDFESELKDNYIYSSNKKNTKEISRAQHEGMGLGEVNTRRTD